jgi:hypothetical protein
MERIRKLTGEERFHLVKASGGKYLYTNFAPVVAAGLIGAGFGVGPAGEGN